METSVFNLNTFYLKNKNAAIDVHHEKLDGEQVLNRINKLLQSEVALEMSAEVRQNLKEFRKGVQKWKDLADNGDLRAIYKGAKQQDTANGTTVPNSTQQH
eukprot:TRINITY_DN22702_c0_g1_i6.p4 TRINITY_DN22702_c0_g1~~TRINITY_DN22702_c0_g1_i6.p4  ORF type:complete len:101 (-),score=11.31 TRINITY_DN22702_c0_g1_i6:567-869(-)